MPKIARLETECRVTLTESKYWPSQILPRDAGRLLTWPSDAPLITQGTRLRRDRLSRVLSQLFTIGPKESSVLMEKVKLHMLLQELNLLLEMLLTMLLTKLLNKKNNKKIYRLSLESCKCWKIKELKFVVVSCSHEGPFLQVLFFSIYSDIFSRPPLLD